MIENDHQYQVTLNWIKEFEETLKQLAEDSTQHEDISPRLLKAEEAGMKSIVADLREQVEVYELKKARPARSVRARRAKAEAKSQPQ